MAQDEGAQLQGQHLIHHDKPPAVPKARMVMRLKISCLHVFPNFAINLVLACFLWHWQSA
jgi:hypothetical protein